MAKNKNQIYWIIGAVIVLYLLFGQGTRTSVPEGVAPTPDGTIIVPQESTGDASLMWWKYNDPAKYELLKAGTTRPLSSARETMIGDATCSLSSDKTTIYTCPLAGEFDFLHSSSSTHDGVVIHLWDNVAWIRTDSCHPACNNDYGCCYEAGYYQLQLLKGQGGTYDCASGREYKAVYFYCDKGGCDESTCGGWEFDHCDGRYGIYKRDCDGTECVETWSSEEDGWEDPKCIGGITGCTDTDGGYDLYKKGTVTATGSSTTGNLVETDKCQSSTVIFEYQCEGNDLVEFNINCPSGYLCENGACISQYGKQGADYVEPVQLWNNMQLEPNKNTAFVLSLSNADKENDRTAKIELGLYKVESGSWGETLKNTISWNLQSFVGTPVHKENCKSGEENVDTFEITLAKSSAEDPLTFNLITPSEPGEYVFAASTYDKCWVEGDLTSGARNIVIKKGIIIKSGVAALHENCDRAMYDDDQNGLVANDDPYCTGNVLKICCVGQVTGTAGWKYSQEGETPKCDTGILGYFGEWAVEDKVCETGQICCKLTNGEIKWTTKCKATGIQPLGEPVSISQCGTIPDPKTETCSELGGLDCASEGKVCGGIVKETKDVKECCQAGFICMTSDCKSNWNCEAWSDPINQCGDRTCTDSNNCKPPNNIKETKKSCDSNICCEYKEGGFIGIGATTKYKLVPLSDCNEVSGKSVPSTFHPECSGIVPGEEVKNIVPGIETKELEGMTTSDLISHGCSNTEQCEEGSKCRSLNWLADKGYITDIDATSMANTLKIQSKLTGTLGGAATGATACALLIGAFTAGTALPIAVPMCAVAGGAIGYKITEWASAIASADKSKLGVCVIESDPFAQITAWIKENPLLAAAIGIGIFVLIIILMQPPKSGYRRK